MVRVNFTPGDVARTRFTVTPAPMLETIEALIELRRAAASGWRHRGRAAPWLREARRAFPATARPLLDLIGPHGPWPDLFDRLTPDLREGIEEVRSAPRARLRAGLAACEERAGQRPALWVRNLADGDREQLELVLRAFRDLHDTVVAPRRDTAAAISRADLAGRIPVLIAGGQEALLGTLHPRLRWRDEGLERTGIDFETNLDGRGLLLRPSAFWTGEPIFSFDPEGHRPHVLIYAAQPNGRPASDNGAADPAAHDSLAALLGPTRAAVLRALREPRGTAELAAAVRISPASASEHAKILRDASLIETRREGRGVRHSLTALGTAMAGTAFAG